MSIVPSLIHLALARIGDIPDDAARHETLRLLLDALDEISAPSGVVDRAFERALPLARGIENPAVRARAFHDTCAAIAASSLALGRRRELLDGALALALEHHDPAERIAAATTVLDARTRVRWGEGTIELLGDLLSKARALDVDEMRARAVLAVATSLAKIGETSPALAAIEGLPPSGFRALGTARVVFALEREGLSDDAARLFRRALAEAGGSPPSPERALALGELVAGAVETGLALGDEPALFPALAATDALHDAAAQGEVLARAVAALADTKLEDAALSDAIDRLDESIAHVGDVDLRVLLRGRLVVSLAAMGELNACIEALRTLVDVVAARHMGSADAHGGAGGGLDGALPILEVLGVLTDKDPDDLERFAAAALYLLTQVGDPRGVADLVGEMTGFFASPALPYAVRVSLLERALGVTEAILEDDVRAEIVAHVADALSIAGATERGDALFAGLVAGIGRERARPARLSRSVALVRLGRTADARAEIAAAAATFDPTQTAPEIAHAMARCGFLGDMLAELERIDAAGQAEARVQLADCLVEATYIDPHLRDIGLAALLEDTFGHTREAIACQLDQVRMLEGLGDPAEVLERAFARTGQLKDRRAAGIFDRQIVGALIERIRRAPHDTEET